VATQIFKRRTDTNGIDRPSASCLPHSVTDFDAYNTPRKVLRELMPDTELLDWVCENNKYFDVLPKER
jgi:hypothetical protein